MKALFNKVDLMVGSVTLGIAFVVIAFMVWFAQRLNLDFSELSRDVISVASVHQFTGFFSNTGIIVWGIAFSALAWGAVFSITFIKSKKLGTMFVAFASLTGLLYLDDFLMIHEMVIVYYLNLPEETMMVLYAVSVILFGVIWHTDLAGKGLILILFSFGCLGMSAAFDLLGSSFPIQTIYILEDGAKFCGIMLWAAFGIRLTFKTMTAYVANANFLPPKT